MKKRPRIRSMEGQRDRRDLKARAKDKDGLARRELVRDEVEERGYSDEGELVGSDEETVKKTEMRSKEEDWREDVEEKEGGVWKDGWGRNQGNSDDEERVTGGRRRGR